MTTNGVFCGSQRGVEQWLARWAHNPKAGGSNPPPATHFPVLSGNTTYIRRGIEQWLARRAHNPEVAGSNPVPATCSQKETSQAGIQATWDISFYRVVTP